MNSRSFESPVLKELANLLGRGDQRVGELATKWLVEGSAGANLLARCECPGAITGMIRDEGPDRWRHGLSCALRVGRCAGECVDPVVFRMSAMTFDPVPFYPVRCGSGDQLLPKLGILDGFLV